MSRIRAADSGLHKQDANEGPTSKTSLILVWLFPFLVQREDLQISSLEIIFFQLLGIIAVFCASAKIYATSFHIVCHRLSRRGQ